MTFLPAVTAVFVVSILSPFVLRPLLQRLGVVDIPNDRSSHVHPTTRGLGLAPLLALVAGYVVLLFAGVTSFGDMLLAVFITVSATAGIVGLIEDVRGLPVLVRALAHLAIGVVGAAAIVCITAAVWWLVPLYGITIAAYINIANFMDGINGISGMHGLVVGGIYAIIGVLADAPWLVVSSVMLGVAFGSFLPWNLLSRGGLFLGDVGSYLLGAGVAVIACAAVATGIPVLAVLGPIIIYLADTGTTLVRRVNAGDQWHKAHRSHAYQRLTSVGLSHVQASSLVTGATIVTGCLGLLTLGGESVVVAVAVIATAAVVVVYLALPGIVRGRAKNKSMERK